MPAAGGRLEKRDTSRSEDDGSGTDDATSMRYAEHAPPPSLAPYVRCVWTLRAPAVGAGAPADAQPIVTDACSEIVLNLADPFRRLSHDGAMRLQPLAMFVGPTVHPTVVQPTGRIDLVGIRLHPW